MVKLTVRTIDKVKPGDKDVLLWDEEVKGFGLKVTPAGRRTFVLFYRTLDHVQRKPSIGNYPAMKPEAARSIAQQMLGEVRAGGDPSAARKARRANRDQDTVSSFFEEYLKAKSKLKSIGEIERIFKHDILPVIGKKRAEEVTRGEISRLIDAINGRSPSVANSARRQLSAFYTWAIPRLPDGVHNPVKSAAKAEPLAKRERVLSDDELARLWRVLEGEPDPWRSALRLLVLTGQRREEVLQASWDEFNLKAQVWTVPAARTKNKLDHLVPLSPAAMGILAGIQTSDGQLFPKGTGPAGRAAARIREAMGKDTPHWRWHDIRRTVATGLQRQGVRLEVTEAILNHVSGSRAGIVGIYQRHDWANEKRAALDAWGLEVERLVNERSPGDS